MRFFVKGQRGTTCVSNIFIDNYMKDANGEFVKIYLYLLRAVNIGDRISVADIADRLDHTQRDIARALKYWERRGLLQLEFDDSGELDGLCLVEPESLEAERPWGSEAEKASLRTPSLTVLSGNAGQTGPAPENAAVLPIDTMNTSSGATFAASEFTMPAQAGLVEPANRDISRLRTPGRRQPGDSVSPADEEAQELLFITEQYMGHPLSTTEVNTILYWYTQMRMSADLIDYLVGYCVDKGHKSIHYMNKVALSWAEQGIKSVAAARSESAGHSKLARTVMDAFGISGRNLSKVETEFLNRWTKVYGLSPELVDEACRRTILNAHAPDFKYADSILRDWHNSGVTSLEDVKAKDEVHEESVRKRLSVITNNAAPSKAPASNRFHNFQGREYDFAALEESLLEEN